MIRRPAAVVLALLTTAAPLPVVAGGPAAATPAVVTPPVADYPAELAPYYTQTLAWTPCDDVQCAWLTVPLDYAAPTGATIRLRLSRVATKAVGTQRLGSLVVNPGGPGASGTDLADYVATSLAPAVAARYDIVGFDPRGVGESAPITCLTGRQTTAWLETDPTPDSRAEEATLMRRAAAIGRGCLAVSPGLAAHVGTENTVADMDVMRAVLGDTSLNWLGFSYGTYLGAEYIQRYPTHVGRMVLDGAVDPQLDAMQLSEGQSEGFQLALTRFAKDCAPRRLCAWGPTTKDVLRGINTLLAGLERSTLPTLGARRLDQAQAITALFFSMYSTALWPTLRTGLRQAARGQGGTLLALADYANDREGPDTYGSNQTSAFYAINCWDVPGAADQAGMRAAARAWSADAPVPQLAAAMAWGNAPCSTWFGHTPGAPAAVHSTTAAPIVVVGTTYDPATPYEWSTSLTAQLPTATLLTRVGDGHTAYGSGSTCIDRALDAFYLSGAVPAPGTVCR